MATNSPTWDCPAKLEGPVFRNWRKGTSTPVTGTMAHCVARWLELPSHNQQDCILSWAEAGRYGVMDARDMAAYVLAYGLPPHVAAARGGQPPFAQLQDMVAMRRPEPTAGPHPPAADARHVGQGPKFSDDP